MAKKAITRMSRKQAPVRGLAAVAVGIAGYYGGRELSSRVDILRERWWVTPAVIGAGGYALSHFASSPLRTKGAAMQGAGVGAMGAAAMLGANNYELQAAQSAAETAGLVNEQWDTQGLVGQHYPLPEHIPYDAHAPAQQSQPSDTGRMTRRHSAYAF